MKLFIVESPNKCAKLRKYLGNEYNVMASVGHIREIPKKGLNIDIRGGFVPTYDIIDGKKNVVKDIKQAASNAEQIILATDPDREGEAISESIYDILPQKDQRKCVRVTFNEITEKAVLDAIKHSRSIDANLVDAQKARQVLDRLIGYKVSPVLWYTAKLAGTSAGRVQSIALKIICEREKEIQAFKPEDYWFLEAFLKAQKGDFWAKVVTKNKDNKYIDQKLAQSDMEKLKKASFIIDSINKKTEQRKPYPPFDTASLQSTCSSVFGWSASKSKVLAQKLYEEGLVSYIRTDSYSISKEAMDEVRELIKDNNTPKYLPQSPNTYEKKSGASAQEAHECIRPTHINESGDTIDDDNEKKMYKLIRDRFIACQMTPMIVDIVEYNIKTNTGHTLIARGQTIQFDGWYKSYKYAKAKEEDLPEVSKGESLKLNEIKCTKHSTKPPPRYKDGSLISKMEADGVGRPSTWETIIKNINDKGYVAKLSKNEGGGYKATDLGLKLFDFLQPKFQDFFMDIKYTSGVEDELNDIAKGNKNFLQVIEAFYEFLSKHIKDLKENSEPSAPPTTTGQKCIVCEEGEIVERNGRFGKFYSCNKYPKCKTIYVQDENGKFSIKQKKDKKVKKTGKKCPDCEKNGRTGELIERINKNNGTCFLGCENWPKCKYCEPLEGEVKKDFSYKKKPKSQTVKEEDDDDLTNDDLSIE